MTVQPISRRANGLGIAATICGALAILFSIVPMCGLIPAVLLSIVGIILGAVGFFAAISDKRTGVGFPVVGLLLCGVAVIVSIVMTVATVGAAASAGKAAQQAAATAATQRSDQIQQLKNTSTTITATELIGAYSGNEISADQNFKGKYVKVSGTVERAGKDLMDAAYVTIKSDTPTTLRQVQCFFSDGKVIANVRSGQSIVVFGRCEGLMGNVLVKECELAQ